MQSTELKSKKDTSWALILLWTLSVLIAVVSLRFLVAEISVVMPFMLHHALARPVSLYLHIGFAPLALILLPLQFNKRLRTARPKLHRWGGRLYALSVLLAGGGSFALGLTTEAGPIAAAGFILLAVLWLATTALAVVFAIKRQIAAHRRWMIRSAALTLAAVTLRLYLPFGELTVGFETAYVAIAWLAWVPNLLLAEVYLRRKPRVIAA
ncbi:DUF2306 domain-containing protein [Cognatishimia maritima]|uniref:Predicted membrane protein n=1 Tax=Cognatishimia maritima TaxID=870908 RepID=A0A1M5KHZ8_9RHOB|nr:DUF2306 domain-containing protein [Cognatishimia maritima]SHG52397.1 Predicted membrane protein [Cognatishimia maritima]